MNVGLHLDRLWTLRGGIDLGDLSDSEAVERVMALLQRQRKLPQLDGPRTVTFRAGPPQFGLRRALDGFDSGRFWIGTPSGKRRLSYALTWRSVFWGELFLVAVSIGLAVISSDAWWLLLTGAVLAVWWLVVPAMVSNTIRSGLL